MTYIKRTKKDLILKRVGAQLAVLKIVYQIIER